MLYNSLKHLIIIYMKKISLVIISALSVAVIGLTIYSTRVNSKNETLEKEKSALSKENSRTLQNIQDLNNKVDSRDKKILNYQDSLKSEKGKLEALQIHIDNFKRVKSKQIKALKELNKVLNSDLTSSQEDCNTLLTKYEFQEQYFKNELYNANQTIYLVDSLLNKLRAENEELKLKFPKNGNFAEIIRKKTLKRRTRKNFEKLGFDFDNKTYDKLIDAMGERKLKRITSPFIDKFDVNNNADYNAKKVLRNN